MRNLQLIHKEEKVIYLKDGVVCEVPKTETEGLLHAIFGETKVITTETVIERWRVKNMNEANTKFWDWMEENKADSRFYYIVNSEQ